MTILGIPGEGTWIHCWLPSPPTGPQSPALKTLLKKPDPSKILKYLYPKLHTPCPIVQQGPQDSVGG